MATPLNLLSLNAAHGRGTGRHQLFQTRRALRDGLDRIAALLGRESPDVVALQEIDGASLPTGSFDHVAHIATQASFPHGVHGHHVHRPGLRYGTALLSRLPLSAPVVHAFAPSFPTPTKGFVAATARFDGADIDIVSVHLDFSRTGVRRRQLGELEAFLRARGQPTVVMGDWNMEPHVDAMRDFAAQTGLFTHAPEARLITFPRFGKRLDVIFHTRELEMTAHDILPDRVSDHLAVTASLAWL